MRAGWRAARAKQRLLYQVSPSETWYKAASNAERHGITFDMARAAFRDAFAIEMIDDGQTVAEERFILLGMVEERCLFVSFTIRGERVRIISARKAEAIERRRYHDENNYP